MEKYCVLRLMESEDIDDVFRIETASYEFPWSQGIFRDCLRAGYHCMVVTDEDAVVGYGILMMGPQEAHLLNLCLAAASRRSGFGKKLLSYFCDYAAARGALEIFLEVRPSNDHAISLYQSFGFNEIGRRPAYYDAAWGREDALILVRTLSSSSTQCDRFDFFSSAARCS
jgi:ribosomal-protein-alanine N-acetyltransferase